MADHPRRIRWADARAALRRLQADPNATDAVFEIVEALAGRHPLHLLERVRRDPEGARLLRERPLFDPRHADMEALEALPEGSFGCEFATWMRDNDFEPGLAERDREGDPDLVYLATRLTQVHDFWHVLSGYNRDPLGELGILAFSVGQNGTRGFAFILANVVWQSIRSNWREERRPWSPLIGYLWRGFRAGRKARFLPPLVLEDWFALPLDRVRETLGIEPLRRSLNAEALPPIHSPLLRSAGGARKREYVPC